MMKLSYCAIEWLNEARDFGAQRWGEAVEVDSPRRFHAPHNVAAVRAGKLSLEEFSGEIEEIDDDDEEVVFFEVRAVSGERREFEAPVEDSWLYGLGRRFLIRYVVKGGIPDGMPFISPLEYWVSTG